MLHTCIHKVGMCSKSDFKKSTQNIWCWYLWWWSCKAMCSTNLCPVQHSMSPLHINCNNLLRNSFILHFTQHFFFIVSTLYFLEKRLIFRYGPCTVSTQKSKLQIEHINQKSSCRNCRCLVKFLYLYPRFRCNIYLGKSEYLD